MQLFCASGLNKEKQRADMTQHFVTAPQPTMKRVADLDGADFYPTPPWATHALIENEKFAGDIWECACGDGAMSDVLQRTGNQVISSDLYDRGYGESGIDFISASRSVPNIVTNPPFHSAEDFVHSGLRSAGSKFALLLRLAFLEGGGRQERIFRETPPARLWVFSERITFYPKGAVKKGSGTTAYAWFVWDKDHLGPTELKWLPVGYKKRF
ncbi:hypothetical protein M4578_13190 [Salipiger sp. P9]|nr:hypothetical protein [Salipiger pentaromativorans]